MLLVGLLRKNKRYVKEHQDTHDLAVRLNTRGLKKTSKLFSIYKGLLKDIGKKALVEDIGLKNAVSDFNDTFPDYKDPADTYRSKNKKQESDSDEIEDDFFQSPTIK